MSKRQAWDWYCESCHKKIPIRILKDNTEYTAGYRLNNGYHYCKKCSSYLIKNTEHKIAEERW